MAPKLRLAHMKKEAPLPGGAPGPGVETIRGRKGFIRLHEDGPIAADLAAWRAKPKARLGAPKILQKLKANTCDL